MNKQTDYKSFTGVWTSIHATFNLKPDPIAIKIAFGALSRWSLDEVVGAIEAHMSNPDTGRFAPTPADIVRLLIGGGSDDLAQLAWSRVERAIRVIGPWQSIWCDDPLILLTIRDMGGWVRLCATESERDLTFVAKDFVRRYSAYVARGVAHEAIDYLPGIEERDIHAAGYLDTNPKPASLPGKMPDALRQLVQRDTGRSRPQLVLEG